MRRRPLVLLLALAAGWPAAARTPAPPPDEPGPAGTLRTGALTLHGCPHIAAYCGSIRRPIDPTGRVPGTVPIAFIVYPHTGPGAAAGTIVAQEGGPGLPSIGSRAGYVALYQPLLGDHDLVIVDPRGTGLSGAIDCLPLQTQPVLTIHATGACGHSLGGASVLYGTGLAADDMIAVLDRLGVGRFDYYGDSYGTFFGQVLAARAPGRLRSVVLDGAYAVRGESPFWPNAAAVVRHGFDRACRLSPYCAALPGTSLDRIGALLALVRRHPISGQAPDGNGRPRHETADAASIGVALFNGLSGPVVYRDMDAAARAATQSGDSAPLLRLVAENDERGPGGRPRGYSRGLEAAVSCMDYPQIYDMYSPLPERRAQAQAAIAGQRHADPGIYGPLTIDEFLTLPIDISLLNFCLDWPIDHPPYPQGHPVPFRAHFTAAPTLVLNGGLDMLTPAADGRLATAEFPNARQVIIANSFHVDAIGDVDDCAQEIVRRFTATLDAGDIACARAVKPVRLVPFFALHAADAVPAIPAGGNKADARARSLAAAAVQTAGDAMARWYVNYSGSDVGLRGGRWHYVQHGQVARFTLDAARWTEDLAVSGDLVWNQANGAVTTSLHFNADDGAQGTVVATWNDRESLAPAVLSGTVDGAALAATMPAP